MHWHVTDTISKAADPPTGPIAMDDVIASAPLGIAPLNGLWQLHGNAITIKKAADPTAGPTAINDNCGGQCGLCLARCPAPEQSRQPQGNVNHADPWMT